MKETFPRIKRNEIFTLRKYYYEIFKRIANVKTEFISR